MKTQIAAVLFLVVSSACATLPRATEHLGASGLEKRITIYEGDSLKLVNDASHPLQLRSDCREFETALAPGQSLVASAARPEVCHIRDGKSETVLEVLPQPPADT